MVVLVLIVLAAALLTHGVLTERPVEVVLAGVLSALGIVAVLIERGLRNRQGADDREAREPEATPKLAVVDEKPIEATEVGDDDLLVHAAAGPAADLVSEVVFVAGRTTFHAPSCDAVDGRIVSAGERSQLERGGMTACRRCLR